MEKQVVVTASSAENSAINVWGLRSGTLLASFKGNATPRNGACLLANDYIVAAQLPKDSLHFYTWNKEAVLQRSFMPEKILALACSPDGSYCCGGGASGSLHVWCVGSGRLLRSWPAHYRAVTVVRWSDGGSMVVSGSEDTYVSVHMLLRVLAPPATAATAQRNGVEPWRSWSEHTLPITDVCVGSGESNPLLISCSLDATIKIRRLHSGQLLCSYMLATPLYCAVLDAGEHSVYCGAENGGIYELAVVEQPKHAASALGVETAAASFTAAAAAVTCLHISTDGYIMVSGHQDGSMRMWDMASRQQLRAVDSACKGAITWLAVLRQPSTLDAAAAMHARGGSSAAMRAPRLKPLAPFAKYQGHAVDSKAWEGSSVVIDGSARKQSIASSCGLLQLLDGSVHNGSDHGGGYGGAQHDGAAQREREELQQQLQQAMQVAQTWQDAHTQLHTAFVDHLRTTQP